MEDLILYGTDRKKKAVINNCIEFECATGRNAYSDNDFILKTPFDKDKLYEIGEWVSYGYTEFGGIIRSRIIDVENEIVTYTGQTYRGILSTILITMKEMAVDTESISGTAHGIMNTILAGQDFYVPILNPSISSIYNATGTDTTQTDVGLFSTSGLMKTNLLYFHDNIVKTFSTAESKAIKSRFSFRNGVITMNFCDGETYHLDSDKVRLKYAENKNNPNICYCSTRKETHTDIFGEFTFYSAKEGTAYLTADGEASQNFLDWVCVNKPATNAIALVVESTGEATVSEEGDVGSDLYNEAADRLLEAQEKPSTEIEIDTEEAEIDDVVVASISELNMKVTKKVVEAILKISNGIPKITYTLEG